MHEYTRTLQVWELTCPGHPQEVGRARRWTRDILAEAPCVEDAALIVTELGSNALRHSSSGNRFGSFHLTLVRAPKTVVVSVADTGGTPVSPRIGRPDEDDTTGRGLPLVTALADHVHVRGDYHHGHTVTAVFHLGAKPSTSSAPPARTGNATC